MAQLVKVVDGLAIASVKVVDGLAIASTKTIMGLDNTSAGGASVSFVAAGTGASADSGNPLATTINGVQAGDGIAIWVGWETASTALILVQESGGSGSASTWVNGTVNTASGGEPLGRWVYTLNATYTGNVTYTFPAAGQTGSPSFMRVESGCFRPSGGTITLDATGVTGTGTGTTFTSSNISTSGASGAVICFGGVKGFTSLTFSSKQIGGSAATALGTDQSDTTAFYRITTLSTQGASASGTGSSDKWVCSVIAFKVA